MRREPRGGGRPRSPPSAAERQARSGGRGPSTCRLIASSGFPGEAEAVQLARAGGGSAASIRSGPARGRSGANGTVDLVVLAAVAEVGEATTLRRSGGTRSSRPAPRALRPRSSSTTARASCGSTSLQRREKLRVGRGAGRRAACRRRRAPTRGAGRRSVESSSSPAIGARVDGRRRRRRRRAAARAGRSRARARRPSCPRPSSRSITSAIAAAASTASSPSGPGDPALDRLRERALDARAASGRRGSSPGRGSRARGRRRCRSARRRRGRRPPGRGSAPALCGPMRSRPPSSSQPIEPPPAPIVCTSIIGSAIAWRLISPWRVTCTSPSLTTERVEARAAHVDDDAVVRAARRARRRARRPGRRPGPERTVVAGVARCELGRRDAAVRLHHEQRPAEATPPRAPRSAARRSARSTGPTYALITVVPTRSFSRTCGRISDETREEEAGRQLRDERPRRGARGRARRRSA